MIELFIIKTIVRNIQLFAERIIFKWSKILSENFEALRPFYNERQRQLCYNARDSVLIKKTIGLLENGLQCHFGVTLLFSMRTESPAS